MRDKLGQFIKGFRPSPATEFKPGSHWRSHKPYWDRDWLEQEYLDSQRSTSDIAAQFGVTGENILYFLRKHGIPRRSIAETRIVKHWGLSGPNNPMYGVTGSNHPNWKGGCTPERQALYSSQEWVHLVKAVWRRDNATCQRCKKYAITKGGNRFHIHHKLGFSEYPDSRLDIDNLVLLCQKCHRWVHSKKNTNGEWKGGKDVDTG